MITIYTVEQARKSILRREMALEPDLSPALQAGMRRIFGGDVTPAEAVSRILNDVRARGDAALYDWTRRIDGVALERLDVPPADLQAAAGELPADLSVALRLAAGRIRAFHALQPVHSWTTEALGGRLGQRVTPLRRVGVYVPGGTAPLPPMARNSPTASKSRSLRTTMLTAYQPPAARRCSRATTGATVGPCKPPSDVWANISAAMASADSPRMLAVMRNESRARR